MQIVLNQAGYYGVTRATAKERAKKYLTQLDLWEKRDARARELSGGMKRRLMIARALMHEPRLLILDEPTAGVDIEIRRSMWTFLKEINEQGITIILTIKFCVPIRQRFFKMNSLIWHYVFYINFLIFFWGFRRSSQSF